MGTRQAEAAHPGLAAKAPQFVSGAGAGLGTYTGAGNPIFCYFREDSKRNCFAIQVHPPGCLSYSPAESSSIGLWSPVLSSVGGWLLWYPHPQPGNLNKLALLLLLAPFFFCSKGGCGWKYTKSGDLGTGPFLKHLALLWMKWNRGRAQGKMCLL